MTIRHAGLATAITLTILIGTLHALAELILATRPKLEAWQLKRAHGMFPRDWHYGQPLSTREIDVLTHRARGLALTDIAAALTVTRATIESHLDQLAAKLGTRSPALLALWSVHLGHVQPADVEQLGEMRWRTTPPRSTAGR